jgi:hypothetical protein
MSGLGMGLGLWKSSGGGNVTPLSIAGSALIVEYDPAYEYALNSGNLSALGNNASAATTYDLTAAGAAYQPPYNAIDATANGKPTIGNMSGDCLRNVSAHPLSGLAAFSVFLVMKCVATGPGQQDIVNGTGFAGSVFTYNDGLYCAPAGIGAYGSAPFSSTSWVVAEFVFDGSLSGNANRLKIFVNGTQQTLAFVSTIPAAVGAVSSFAVGSNVSTGTNFTGKIAQLLCLNTADTAGVNPRLRRYLGAKFGITVV